MANIRIDLAEVPVHGQTLTFKSPADCSEVMGLIVYYPEDDITISKIFQFADAHGNNVGSVSLFAGDVLVKVILDTKLNRAYVQNADTNAYLEAKFNTKAPAGYGLGSSVVDIKAADLNATTYNGWYRIAGANDLTIGGYKYGDWYVHVSKYSNSNLVQEMYTLNGYKLIRLCHNGTWYEEWETPPMELGKEYRTTERHNGNPVYVKRLDLGTLPSSGNKATTYVAGNGGDVVRWEAFATSGSGSYNTFPFFTAGGDLRAKIYFTEWSVVVTAISDSSGNTGTATIWYTKR